MTIILSHFFKKNFRKIEFFSKKIFLICERFIKVFKKKLFINPLTNSMYFNVKKMNELIKIMKVRYSY